MRKAPTLPDGRTRNIFLTLLHHPILLERFNALAGTFMRFGLIPAAERELVILRVAARTRCSYELAQHLALAREAGLDDDALLAAIAEGPENQLTDRQALLLSVTDELLARGTIADRRWEELAARYEPAAVLELICLIGFYRMAADLLNVVGVEDEIERR